MHGHSLWATGTERMFVAHIMGGRTIFILGGLSINIANFDRTQQAYSSIMDRNIGGGGVSAPKPYGFCRLCTCMCILCVYEYAHNNNYTYMYVHDVH